MSKEALTRRQVIGAAAGSLALAAVGVESEEAAEAAAIQNSRDWAFLLLGDIHYDQLDHHDMEWLAREKPNDVRQVQDYSRITREVLPGLFDEMKSHLSSNRRITLVSHIGDFVEGLAGTPPLARKHCEDAVAFVRNQKLGKPFVFVKGNHDITGPGSVEAFNEILLPFTAQELKRKSLSSNFTERRGECLFVYFDAYVPESLDWLEKTLATERKKEDRHLFFVIHPPVVPYGARSTWHVYAKPADAQKRTRLLNLLGKERAIVLCGHLHKNGTVVRKTPEGAFVQLAVVSVISNPKTEPKNEVTGLAEYGPDLVRLEPNFSPDTIEQRREYLKAEAPFIRHYEYGDVPGYAIVSVKGDTVIADQYVGLGKRLWKSNNLTDLLKKA